MRCALAHPLLWIKRLQVSVLLNSVAKCVTYCVTHCHSSFHGRISPMACQIIATSTIKLCLNSSFTSCPSVSRRSSAFAATVDNKHRRRCSVSLLQGGSRNIRSWMALSWSELSSTAEKKRYKPLMSVKKTKCNTTLNSIQLPPAW